MVQLKLEVIRCCIRLFRDDLYDFFQFGGIRGILSGIEGSVWVLDVFWDEKVQFLELKATRDSYYSVRAY